MKNDVHHRDLFSLATCLLLLGGCLGVPSLLTADEIAENDAEQPWRYTLQQPAAGWQKANFDDSAWQQGFGGFGAVDTPGARVGTRWATPNIWLRQQLTIAQRPPRPALYMHHDEDVEVYLNGQLLVQLEGFVSEYQVVPIAADKWDAFRAGENTLAVHCRQTRGGQFIDVHIIDADHVPELPQPPRPEAPFKSDLITKWGADVTPENAWREYPRPSLRRADWLNLNGLWDYAITDIDAPQPTAWEGEILVPFPVEAKLSGVQKLLDADEALWYRRIANLPADAQQRTLLNFEAVDYRCRVFVNGQDVGGHVGGNAPFTLDISDAVRDGENELVVRVVDATERDQLNGKQSLTPRGIWYTQVSGIWQTVWVEQVPRRSIDELDIETDPATGMIAVAPTVRGALQAGDSWLLEVLDGQHPVATANVPVGNPLQVQIAEAKLWSPASPHLYDLRLSLQDSTGETIDQIQSYAGIRSVGKMRDADGHLRFTLNGQPIFHWGPLDQGWWPDGLLTPPSDAAMLFDIEFLKEAGFNMIRKHIKVEPRRYYYHCDRLGMMVWQDQVSGGKRPPWTRLAPRPQDAEWTDAAHAQFMQEFEEMVDELEFHPSVVVWTPFNEAWGQHRTLEVGRWIIDRDPSRIVNIASGGNFWPVGDVVDHHSYPHPEFPFAPQRFQDYIKVVGEFGGHGLPVAGHLWDSNRDNWGYGGLPKDAAEYRSRYEESLRRLDVLRARGIAAGVYTQTTDVEGEINGLISYDRKVIKIPAKELRELHQLLFQAE